jgi:hypothetical protein
MDVMRPYFDEEPTEEWTSGELRDLQAYLRNCELRYVIYSPPVEELIDSTLHLAANAIAAGVANAGYEMVTVVLPPKR